MFTIRQAAVIGAGTMGAQIAAQLANVGIPSLLLDIVPGELLPDEQQRGLTLRSPEVRNRVTQTLFDRAKKLAPAPFSTPDAAKLVRLGNVEDHLAEIKDADWIIEAVLERMDVKLAIHAKIAANARPDALVTTNTSGLSIVGMARALPPEYRRRFFGAHFFNPPRYVRLLELIPTADTDPALLKSFGEFGEIVLGKGIVRAKDTPGFVANRIGCFDLQQVVWRMIEQGLSIDEVDAITGPAMGRPTSATFRLGNMIGVDLMAQMSRNLRELLPHDPQVAVFRPVEFIEDMIQRGWWGRKKGKGFFQRVKSATGRQILTLDYRTMEYRPQQKPQFASLEAAGKIADPAERLRALCAAPDPAGVFAWKHLSSVLCYAADRLTEIADDVVTVDNAMKWGYHWELGPFEIWDALGVREIAERLTKEGRAVPAAVRDLLATGQASFYEKRDQQRSNHSTVSGLEHRTQDSTITSMKTAPSLIALLGYFASFFCQSQLATAADTKAAVAAQVQQQSAGLLELYRHFHASPELSFQETRTAARLAEELQQAGYAVTRNVGGNGVVALLKNGEGPTLLLRTELDALPLAEQTSLPYASKAYATNHQGIVVGVMHACGHDVHLTCLTGAARVLVQLKDQWRGTLLLIGQPAEEKLSGARSMLKDGLFDRFPKPDYCLALHVASDQAAGTLGYVENFALANVDSVDITIRGVGGHGAWPHLTKDPIVLAAETILVLQTIVSREVQPGEPAVVTVGAVHGGATHNVIPAEVKLQLTVRSFSEKVRVQLLEAIRRQTRGLALAAGLPEDRTPIVTVTDESSPALCNDPVLTRRVAGVFEKWFGRDHLMVRQPVMGSEDFGEFGLNGHKIPVTMFWLGTVPPEVLKQTLADGKIPPVLHSSTFKPDPEPTIKTGVTALVAATLELLPNSVAPRADRNAGSGGRNN